MNPVGLGKKKNKTKPEGSLVISLNIHILRSQQKELEYKGGQR